MANENTKSLAVLTHILGLFTGFIGPLIMMLASSDEEVKKHARVALNWQISLIIYAIVSLILVFVFIGFILLAAIGIANTIFCIMAAVKANEGIVWKYPLSIQFFK